MKSGLSGLDSLRHKARSEASNPARAPNSLNRFVVKGAQGTVREKSVDMRRQWLVVGDGQESERSGLTACFPKPSFRAFGVIVAFPSAIPCIGKFLGDADEVLKAGVSRQELLA